MEKINNYPLVTVGIPTYNRSSKLKFAVESVLKQTYTNIEIIVFDNASTDETELYCNSVSKNNNNFKYYKQEKNVGPMLNFSSTLKFKKGEYFVFLSDDDFFSNNYIDECVKFLNQNPDYSCVKGVTKWYNTIHNNNTKFLINRIDSNSPILRLIKYYKSPSKFSALYGLMRTSDLEKTRFISTFPFDWYFESSIVFLGKFATLNNIIINRSADGVSSNTENLFAQFNIKQKNQIILFFIVSMVAAKEIFNNKNVYYNLNKFKKYYYSFIIFLICFFNHVLLHQLRKLRYNIFIFLFKEKLYNKFKNIIYKLNNHAQ